MKKKREKLFKVSNPHIQRFAKDKLDEAARVNKRTQAQQAAWIIEEWAKGPNDK